MSQQAQATKNPLSEAGFDEITRDVKKKIIASITLLHDTKTHEELHGLIAKCWTASRDGINGTGSLTATFILEAFLAVTFRCPDDTDPELKSMRMAHHLEDLLAKMGNELSFEDFIAFNDDKAEGEKE